jgi:hypothetical protein
MRIVSQLANLTAQGWMVAVLFLQALLSGSIRSQFPPPERPEIGKLPFFSKSHEHVLDLHLLGRLTSPVSSPSCYPACEARLACLRTATRWLVGYIHHLDVRFRADSPPGGRISLDGNDKWGYR